MKIAYNSQMLNYKLDELRRNVDSLDSRINYIRQSLLELEDANVSKGTKFREELDLYIESTTKYLEQCIMYYKAHIKIIENIANSMSDIDFTISQDLKVGMKYVK